MPDNNYPIVEALAEFRFQRKPIAQDILQRLQECLQPDYPNQRVLNLHKHHFEQSEQAHAQSYEQSQRYQFFAANSLSLVQVDDELFTVNKLKPYGSWEDMAARIISVTDRLSAVLDVTYTEMILQYVNRIPINEGDKLEHILQFRPTFDGPFVACSAAVIQPDEELSGTIQVQMQTMADESEQGFIMLNLLAQTPVNDLSNARSWLDRAHSALDNKYKACVVVQAVMERLNV